MTEGSNMSSFEGDNLGAATLIPNVQISKASMVFSLFGVKKVTGSAKMQQWLVGTSMDSNLG